MVFNGSLHRHFAPSQIVSIGSPCIRWYFELRFGLVGPVWSLELAERVVFGQCDFLADDATYECTCGQKCTPSPFPPENRPLSSLPISADVVTVGKLLLPMKVFGVSTLAIQLQVVIQASFYVPLAFS